jgi:hypothetical protein
LRSRFDIYENYRSLRAAHAASHGTYGAPRIHVELADKGIRVGRKRRDDKPAPARPAVDISRATRSINLNIATGALPAIAVEQCLQGGEVASRRRGKGRE